MTVVLQRLEVPIPRKISNQSSAHEKVCVGLRYATTSSSCNAGPGSLLSKLVRVFLATCPILLAVITRDCHCLTWMGAGRSLRFHNV